MSLFGLGLALLLTPMARAAFLRLGLVDQPDGTRKLHRTAVPRIGGIPIAFSYVGAFAFLLLLPAMHNDAFRNEIPFIVRLLPAACVVFLTGLLDDLFDLRPRWKLAGQLVSAGLAVNAGLQIRNLGGQTLPDWTGIIATVVWLVFCANAFNLIDGLDGLASGMGLFATMTMLAAALFDGNAALAIATAPLAGALLGFLRYNFNPASVFLGDSGSLLVGFLLGCYGIQWSQKSTTLLGLTGPAMAMAIPLADASLSIIRRWIRGKPIFSGDRNHIHHRLLAHGLTHRTVVLLLYCAGCVFAILSVTGAVAEGRWSGAALLIFCGLLWYGIKRLGYLEFTVASRVVFGGALSNAVQGRIALHSFSAQLERAESIGEAFSILSAMASEFGFTGIEACFRDRVYSNHTARPIKERCWMLRVPVAPGCEVTLLRSFHAPPFHGVVMAIVETLAGAGSHLGDLPFEAGPTEVNSILGLAAELDAGIPKTAMRQRH
jgi:UDP-GlcNAc:undecaprenyl-phosphate GlcNAc-1-phosphate transferase